MRSHPRFRSRKFLWKYLEGNYTSSVCWFLMGICSRQIAVPLDYFHRWCLLPCATSNMSSRFPPLLRRQLCRSFSTSIPQKADHARIVEVGPRDGLQNEKSIPLQTKIQLVNRLAKTGVTHLEAGSFVPAKWVPQVRSYGIICSLRLKISITF